MKKFHCVSLDRNPGVIFFGNVIFNLLYIFFEALGDVMSFENIFDEL